MTLNDATGEIYSAFLVEEEGSRSRLRGLVEVIGRHGLVSSLYSDRGSHYFVTPLDHPRKARVANTWTTASDPSEPAESPLVPGGR